MTLTQKQASLCAIVIKACDNSIIEQLRASQFNTADSALSLKHNIGLLINEIIRLTEITGPSETPLDRLNFLLYSKTNNSSELMDIGVNRLHTIFKRYQALTTIADGEKAVDTAYTALKLKEKEAEVIRHFIYHGINNKEENLYIYLFELINGKPPIEVPHTFELLIRQLTQCRSDLLAGKSISVNLLARVLPQVTYGTVLPNGIANSKNSKLPSPTDSPKVDNPATAQLPPPKSDTSSKVCKDAARNFAEQACYREVHTGNTDT